MRKLIVQLTASLLVLFVINNGVCQEFELGARPAGMGGAFTAVSNDVYTTIWNPAGLSLVNNYELSAGYHYLFANIDNDNLHQGNIAFVFPFRRCVNQSCWQQSAGINVSALSSEIFNELIIKGSWGIGFLKHRWAKGHLLHFGLRPGLIRYGFEEDNSVDPNDPLFDTSVGFKLGLDAGFMLTTRYLNLGITYENLIKPRLSVEDVDEGKLPGILRFGGAVNFLNTTLSIEEEYKLKELNGEADTRLHLGLEGHLGENLALRAGADGKEWLNFGIGLKFNRFKFDYALQLPWQDSPAGLTTHKLSIGYIAPRRDYPDLGAKPEKIIIGKHCGKLEKEFISVKKTIEAKKCRVNSPFKVGLYYSKPIEEVQVPPVAVVEIKPQEFKGRLYAIHFDDVKVNDIVDKEEVFLYIDMNDAVREGGGENNNIVALPIEIREMCRNLKTKTYVSGNCHDSRVVPTLDSVDVRVDVILTGEIALDRSFKLGVYSKYPGEGMEEYLIVSTEFNPEEFSDTIYSMRFSWLPETWEDELYSFVDYEDNVIESYEDDNIEKVSIKYAPQLTVSGIDAEPIILKATYEEYPIVPLVYFDALSSDVKPDMEHNINALNLIGERMEEYPEIDIVLYGYSDVLSDSRDFVPEDFTQQYGDKPRTWLLHYNDTKEEYRKQNWKSLSKLANDRSLAVRDYILSKFLGISSSRITVYDRHNVIDGINNCLDVKMDSWFENRRVEIRVGNDQFADMLYLPVGKVKEVKAVTGSTSISISGVGGGASMTCDLEVVDTRGKVIKSFPTLTQNNFPFQYTWDGKDNDGSFLDGVKQYRYAVEILSEGTCQLDTLATEVDLTYENNIFFVRLFKFSQPDPRESRRALRPEEYYSPSLQRARNALDIALKMKDKNPGIELVLESYASYLNLFGKNYELATQRNAEVKETFNLSEDDINLKICGDECAGEREECSGLWCPMMNDQPGFPANRALSRATILIINYK
ncbi:type IX secretion system membrane protein PorP/SprF [bacterium]|nr:type IX secretion system membrane protein PorP/SprF [bacterium]